MDKVLIVGGGPAGLACAFSILESNPEIDVTVVEKKSKIGNNPRCAGGISKWMMEKIGFTVPKFCIITKIAKFRIYAPDENYWELKGDLDYGYVLDRGLFERDIAKNIEKLGGTFTLDHTVTFEDLDLWQNQYDYIIGADGPTSVVRQWLGISKIPTCDIHLGIQKTVTMDSYPQDTIKIFFGRNVAPKGYAWCFPAGNGLVRVGLGVPLNEEYRKSNAGRLLENFIERQVCNYKVVDSVAKLIPTARMPKTGIYGKVVLVGDALPSTDPVTGGGVCQGMASGKAAAQAIVDGKPWLYDNYICWLRKQNYRRYRLKKILFSFNDQDLNNMIKTMYNFKPKSLSVGKELKRGVIHLLLRRPSLWINFLKPYVKERFC